MTTLNKIVGAPLARNFKWEAIKWNTVKYHVRKLQVRIAKAIKLGRRSKAKALQWLLTHSFYAKLLAVRRVTQNRGKNTPGVDGVLWRTSHQKMQAVEALKRRGYRSLPLKRIHIPKKNGKLRPLGIHTKGDLAQQALHLLAIEPVAEILADKNSYGFRPKRSAHDAIAQCFTILATKRSAKWILEGDIKSCFDKISHQWLQNSVMIDKQVLKQWLKAGYIERNTFHYTEEGTPQGGIASPTMCNIALDGLENTIHAVTQRGDKVNFVRYADDWICTAASREILEEKVLPTVISFLSERGLELSQEKTRITHINEGFDFLGFNLRKYKEKLLIKPAKKGIKTFLTEIRKVVYSKRTDKAEELIRTLNPKIRGWVNYFKHCVAKEIFSQVDSSIFGILWRWSRRRHPEKATSWVKKKYFTRIGQRDWNFFSRVAKKGKDDTIILIHASETRIVRYVKIKGAATPYDPEFKKYFSEREIKQRMKREHSRVMPHSLRRA